MGFEKLFWVGPKLGCSVEIPQATLVCNYLVDGFLKCIQLTQSFDLALEALNRLKEQEPSVTTLIAQVLIMKDEEIQAVQVICEGISKNKRDSELLLLECNLLIEKKRYDLALHLAKQAVQSSPSDFKTWAALVKVYTKLNDFENALLTLNSCPMNSHKEKFINTSLSSASLSASLSASHSFIDLSCYRQYAGTSCSNAHLLIRLSYCM